MRYLLALASWNGVLVSGLFVASTCLIVALYRLFWHPLARYPGPLLGRLTDWYSVYHAVKGDRHLDFYRLHLKYGEIVRYGPNRISINSEKGLKGIYGPHANTQKSKFYSVFDHFFGAPSTETTIDKQQHSRKRRILARGLSEKNLKAMEGTIVENWEFLRQKICPTPDGEWSSTHNMSRLFSQLTFDIMGGICFARGFGELEGSDSADLVDVISDGAQALNAVGHMPELLKLRLEGLLMPRLMNGLIRYKQYSTLLANSCGEFQDRPSVVTSLLEEARHRPEETFTSAELVSEISLLVIAGSDTTATALSNTLFHLLSNPACLARLRKELDETFTSVDDIVSGRTLGGCAFLYACINESLRLSPPVGGLLPREVLPGGLPIDGHLFPEGTDVGVPTYALHHCANHFPDPWVFDPDRWLGAGGAPSSFCAWSIGSRSCLGSRMAYMELMIIIGRLAWLYDFGVSGDGATAGSEADAVAATRLRDEQTIDKFVGQVQGPCVRFRRRWPHRALGN